MEKIKVSYSIKGSEIKIGEIEIQEDERGIISDSLVIEKIVMLENPDLKYPYPLIPAAPRGAPGTRMLSATELRKRHEISDVTYIVDDVTYSVL